MKINYEYIQSMFDGLLHKMDVQDHNIKPLANKPGWRTLNPTDLEALSISGLDVEPCDVRADNNGLLSYRGHKVTLYIRDVSTYGRRQELPKFHFTKCSTLEDMMTRGRYSRYVVTTKVDQEYLMNIDKVQKWTHLDVCKNCLKSVMGEVYTEMTTNQKNQCVQNFDVLEAFEKYGYNEARMPLHNSSTAHLNQYSLDWPKVSRDIKRLHNWICSKCRINLSNDTKFLDAHHKDGEKSNNDPNNLDVLCVKCHSECEMHGHMKSEPRLVEFLLKYKKK